VLSFLRDGIFMIIVEWFLEFRGGGGMETLTDLVFVDDNTMNGDVMFVTFPLPLPLFESA